MLYVKQSKEQISVDATCYILSIRPKIQEDRYNLIMKKLNGHYSIHYLFVFSVLNQAGFFSSPDKFENFIILFKHENIVSLSTTLIYILRLNFLNDDNNHDPLNLLIKHDNIGSLEQAIKIFSAITRHNFLIPGLLWRKILNTLQTHSTPLGIARALILLPNPYDNRGWDSIDAVLSHPCPQLLADQIFRVWKLGIRGSLSLQHEIFQFIAESSNLDKSVKKIESMYESGAFSDNRRSSNLTLSEAILRHDLGIFRSKLQSNVLFFLPSEKMPISELLVLCKA